MAPAQLFSAINRQPFVPFRIHTSDGAYHDVRHPEMCFVGMRTTQVYVPPPDDPDGFGEPIQIDNLHITRLEPLPAPTNPAGNGQPGA